MKTNTGITIFHKGYDKVLRLNTWIPKYFPKASLQEDVKMSVLATGLQSANVVKIRIPTAETIDIAKGDRVVVGDASSSSAPPDNAYTVVGFSDNRKGSRNVWHWKVTCA